MRSHEGNRPRDNLQIDQDEDVLGHFARMTTIYVHLAPYLRSLSEEAVAHGLPVQRPLFLHHEDDAATYAIQDAYLYGADMLVAPIWQAGETERSVHLPAGRHWVHAWSGEVHPGGAAVTVAAPLGRPPVFYAQDAAMADLFAGLQDL